MLKISLPYDVGMKSYEFRKTEKVGQNHVPTCPVFAGLVTNVATRVCAIHYVSACTNCNKYPHFI